MNELEPKVEPKVELTRLAKLMAKWRALPAVARYGAMTVMGMMLIMLIMAIIT